MTRQGSGSGWLRTLAARLCAPESLERVIDPTLADFRLEMQDAAGQRWKRGYLRLATGAAFVKVVVLCGYHRVRHWHSTSDETRALNRTACASLIAALVALALFMLPPLLRMPSIWWPAVLYLVPQAVPLAFPMGLTIGILCGLRPGNVSHRVRTSVVVAAVVCSVVSFAVMAWVLPMGNQAFRECVHVQLRGGDSNVMRASRPQKGLNELTIAELRRRLTVSFPDERGRRLVTFSYYERWAFPCATVTLALLAIAIVSRWRLPQFVVWVVAGSTFWAYYLVMFAGREYALAGTVPAVAAAWLPNAVGAVAIALLDACPSRPIDQAT
jgi:hypothetical protein